jgi:hypothetical protein
VIDNYKQLLVNAAPKDLTAYRQQRQLKQRIRRVRLALRATLPAELPTLAPTELSRPRPALPMGQSPAAQPGTEGGG